MRRKVVPLTDTQLRNAKPKDKDYKLTDGGGLYLLVNDAGSKLWRLDYSFGGKRKTLSIGVYPVVSLADARERRLDAKKLIANDVDPGEVRKAQKAAREEVDANSFEVIALEWFNKFALPRLSNSNTDKIIARLKNDLFPWIGKRPITAITPPELLSALRRIEARGAVDTAHRVRQNVGQIYRYAIATGRAERDISADLRGALPPPKKSHFAAIIDPKELVPLLRASDDYRGTFPVKCALKLAPMVFLRPGELRNAQAATDDREAIQNTVDAEKCQWQVVKSILGKDEFALNPEGVHQVVISEGRIKSQMLICAPLRIVADSRDGIGENWGRVLEFDDKDDKLQRYHMKMQDLRRDGDELIDALLSRGLSIAPGKKARNKLVEYIQNGQPVNNAKALSSDRTGWHG